MAFGVADYDDSFEAGALAGAGLFLHGFDLEGRIKLADLLEDERVGKKEGVLGLGLSV